MFRIIAGLIFCSIMITAGCGGSGTSNTNGTLALTVTPADLTGGRFSVVALATYTPLNGKNPTGTPITLTASIHTLNGTPIAVSDALSADPSGVVTRIYNVNQTTQTVYVDVTASTGGLVKSFSISIPSLAVMTTSPATVAFPSNALAGSTQTITISGGTSPFGALMDAAHAGDMTINVNGATVTLTKRNNSGVNPIIGALLTITDNSGNSVTIPVGYN